MTRKLLVLASSFVLLVAARADAAPVCTTVAQFNADAIANGITARSGTLTFKATGIDPNVGKGALASLVDVRTKDAMGGPCVGTYFKVYGPGVDLGKVKDELFNVCCVTCATCTTERGGALGCETWAGEARSSVIFTAPSQTCDFEIRFGGTPNQHSYSVKCDDGTGDTGVGDNLYLLEVNRVSLLEGYGGIGKIDGATVLSNQFCYEALSSSGADAGVDVGAKPSGTTTLFAVEDVTASSASPTTVYPDVNDLSVGNDSEVYLKFVVPGTVGAVKKATLTLTVADTPSAEGHGGALYRVESNAWSESTLVWNGRPARGARLGRVGPGAANQKLTLDVTSAVTGGATLSYAMAIEATDTNGTHFFSKEASPTNAPALTIEYAAPTSPPTDAGAPGDSGPRDSGPVADAAPTVDAACKTAACSGASPDDSRSAEDGDLTGGCTIHHAGRPLSFLPLLALALAAALFRRPAR